MVDRIATEEKTGGLIAAKTEDDWFETARGRQFDALDQSSGFAEQIFAVVLIPCHAADIVTKSGPFRTEAAEGSLRA